VSADVMIIASNVLETTEIKRSCFTDILTSSLSLPICSLDMYNVVHLASLHTRVVIAMRIG